jgi:sialate O-acetylesterase
VENALRALLGERASWCWCLPLGSRSGKRESGVGVGARGSAAATGIAGATGHAAAVGIAVVTGNAAARGRAVARARCILSVLGLPATVVTALLVGMQAQAQVGPQAQPDTQAQTSLAFGGLFQDHAVLQRDRPIVVWGRAASGEGVSVSLGAATATTRADPSGQWSVQLPAMSAGGPFVLSAQGSAGVQQAVRDVLVGDVFLCSGQSNMELPVRRAGDTDSEIRDSRNDTIRMLTVEHASSLTVQTEFTGPLAWQSAAPETVPAWSAACFFFGRELQKTVHVPIGLVNASWGGANIRPWMSTAALHASGGYESALGLLALYAKDPAAAQSQLGREWEAWWRGKSGERVGEEPWSVGGRTASAGSGANVAPATNAQVWQTAPAELGDWRYWGVPQLKDFTGLVWFRTHLTLSASQAKAATRIDLGAINQVDETWINGRVIGNTFGYNADRSYAITPGVLHAGDNVLVINALSNYGSGGLLQGGARRALQLADGKSVPLDGPWQYRVAPPSYGYPPRAPWEPVGGLSTLYNAMIAPLGRYAFRGAVWYQGESNTEEANSYQALLTGLMADWRHQFGAELPFLVVQLPNYGKLSSHPEESGWAELREAQRAAVAKDPHAGLAVTIDIGDPHNLHPTNKQDVGRRLARAARHVIYGESIAPSGPVALSATRESGDIVVGFRDVDRTLVAYSHDSPIGFELCGDAPHSCRFAQVRIEGTKVVLETAGGASETAEGAATSASAASRTAGGAAANAGDAAKTAGGVAITRVRYCWADSPVCTLFDASGLPAGPFELRVSAGAGQ